MHIYDIVFAQHNTYYVYFVYRYFAYVNENS